MATHRLVAQRRRPRQDRTHTCVTCQSGGQPSRYSTARPPSDRHGWRARRGNQAGECADTRQQGDAADERHRIARVDGVKECAHKLRRPQAGSHAAQNAGANQHQHAGDNLAQDDRTRRPQRHADADFTSAPADGG